MHLVLLFVPVLIVVCVFALCVKPASAFKLSRSVPNSRLWNGNALNTNELVDISEVCNKIVAEQENVVVIPRGMTTRRKWIGGRTDVVDLRGERSIRSTILPFVDRIDELKLCAESLLENLDKADQYKSGLTKVSRTMELVGTGALFGAGKTTFGSVLHQVLASLLQYRGKVVRVSVELINSPFIMWDADICAVPELQGLRDRIDEGMNFKLMLTKTSEYLEERELFLFLHLDEFIPFNDKGKFSVNSNDNFYDCWLHHIMPILQSPRICLFISGRMAYYDQIGTSGNGSPCRVFTPQLQMFDPAIICDALRKIHLPDPSDEFKTQVLANLLDYWLPPSKEAKAGSVQLAERVYFITGGVPRAVESVMTALLSDVPFVRAIQGAQGTDWQELLDGLFQRDGVAYRAAVEHAKRHMASCIAVIKLLPENEAAVRLAGLLLVLLNKDTEFDISRTDESGLREGMGAIMSDAKLQTLLQDAQYWGIHRSIDKVTRKLRFSVPPTLMDILPEVISKTEIASGLLGRAKKDPTGQDAEKEVEYALMLMRLLSVTFPAFDLPGLKALQLPGLAALTAGERAHALRPGAYELPRLPKVINAGQMGDVQDVLRVAYAQGGSTACCSPSLLGDVLEKCSREPISMFSTAPRSACADFMVVNYKSVAHVQVKDVKKFLSTHLLDEIIKVASVVRSSQSLKHTLVVLLMQSEERKRATDSPDAMKVDANSLAEELRKLAEEQDGAKKNGWTSQEINDAKALVENGELQVKILNDEEFADFFRFNALAKQLVQRL